MRKVQADYVSLTHKLHAPKGVGALYVRQRAPFSPLIHGGQQERNRRGEVGVIFRAGTGVSQFQQNKLGGQDGSPGFGLRQGPVVRRVTRVRERLIEKRVREDSVHDGLETP